MLIDKYLLITTKWQELQIITTFVRTNITLVL